VIILKRYFSQVYFSVDKVVAFSIVDSTILISFLFPKGVVDRERTLELPAELVYIENLPLDCLTSKYI